jgi:hypothetical protein
MSCNFAKCHYVEYGILFITILNVIMLVSISPTFYEQLLRQNPFAKKLQTQIVENKSCAKKFVRKSC